MSNGAGSTGIISISVIQIVWNRVLSRLFPARMLGGRKLRFLPSDVRQAHCLPFSGKNPATQGICPLETPSIPSLRTDLARGANRKRSYFP
jgi:hypothetical protein